jgi:ribosomal protein S18 acetylase RimI-like enzyme
MSLKVEELRFRKLKRRDKKALLEFAKKLTTEAKTNWGLLETPEQITKFIMREYDKNGITFSQKVIGLMGKEIVCYGKVSKYDCGINSYGYLEGIITRTDLQNKGIGTSLMHYLEKLAEDNGCPYAKLEVFKENAHALEFYQNLGYKKRGQCWGSWYLRKSLNPKMPKKESLFKKIKDKLRGQ